MEMQQIILKVITGVIDKLCNELTAIKIQKWFRGYIFRVHRLPLIMYQMQHYLQSITFEFSTQTQDGRTNSCLDEDELLTKLTNKFGNKIKTPKIRMWYDLLAFDYYLQMWIPVNIKTTTTITSDNTGNLAMCLYAYTNEPIDLNKSFTNGKTSILLFKNLKNKQYNKIHKKDYYFLVLNKTSGLVIINSVKGLSVLTANSNNLPFQICWNKNKRFQYQPIRKKIMDFITCLQKPLPSWSETFMQNIRTLHLE